MIRLIRSRQTASAHVLEPFWRTDGHRVSRVAGQRIVLRADASWATDSRHA
jgi:hypothetical protein